jgi:hypothetical protein
MRTVVLVLGLLMLPGSGAYAAAQHFCKGCGCKTGSGWRHNATQKCIGCEPELSKRCGMPATKNCNFEGQ